AASSTVLVVDATVSPALDVCSISWVRCLKSSLAWVIDSVPDLKIKPNCSCSSAMSGYLPPNLSHRELGPRQDSRLHFREIIWPHATQIARTRLRWVAIKEMLQKSVALHTDHFAPGAGYKPVAMLLRLK